MEVVPGWFCVVSLCQTSNLPPLQPLSVLQESSLVESFISERFVRCWGVGPAVLRTSWWTSCFVGCRLWKSYSWLMGGSVRNGISQKDLIRSCHSFIGGQGKIPMIEIPERQAFPGCNQV